MSKFTVFVAVCACFVVAVSAYVPSRASYGAPAAYAPASYAAPRRYAAPAPRRALAQVNIPDLAILSDTAEAKASAQSARVGAQATSQTLNANNFDALDRYGYEIGRPLLVKPYGPLTNLYAAALPARSYVAQIDPAFIKDSYGNVKHISESSLGVAVI